MIMDKLTLFICFLFILTSCDFQSNRDDYPITPERYSIRSGQDSRIEYRFYSNGTMAYIQNQINENEIQIVRFWPNGQIKSKEKIDSLGNKIGRHYEFHKESAFLKSDFRYEDGKRYGSGMTYYPSRASKQHYLYDEEGILRHAIKFDEQGDGYEVIGDPDFQLDNEFWIER